MPHLDQSSNTTRASITIQADTHIHYIPCQVKVYSHPHTGPMFLLRRSDVIGVFSSALRRNLDKHYLPLPTPWATLTIPSGYYMGDFEVLPGRQIIVYLLHHRGGEKPSLLKTAGLPPIPDEELTGKELPGVQTTRIILESGHGENNVLLHCNSIIILPDSTSARCNILLGEKGSSEWFKVSFGSAAEPSIDERLAVVESTLLPDPEINEASLSRILADLREKLIEQSQLPYDIDGDRLSNDDFFSDWDTGDILTAYDTEIELWPEGVLCGFDGTTTDFIFTTGQKGHYRFFAIRVDYKALIETFAIYKTSKLRPT
ncbi:hypothetical protein CALVIDRAFT_530472 [Calocera viscosa TUFC12733]|uniref:Uncharacterized protein n=1 Tax=Calocera viscosa (strain TUFC12733) TaxID=1330018 RepID=A0A167HR19_CALVF|nr:hypothetical protein CALVIDRAFT_530472 [Calocera viscosa TUFC12733]